MARIVFRNNSVMEIDILACGRIPSAFRIPISSRNTRLEENQGDCNMTVHLGEKAKLEWRGLDLPCCAWANTSLPDSSRFSWVATTVILRGYFYRSVLYVPVSFLARCVR